MPRGVRRAVLLPASNNSWKLEQKKSLFFCYVPAKTISFSFINFQDYCRSTGAVAHMVEHSLCMRGVQGSIPCSSIFVFISSFILTIINELTFCSFKRYNLKYVIAQRQLQVYCF